MSRIEYRPRFAAFLKYDLFGPILNAAECVRLLRYVR